MNDLRDELRDFARHIDVPTRSAAETVVRARRRSQLTIVTRVGAAALVVGAGVIGVQQLTDRGLSGDPIAAPNGAASPIDSSPTAGPAGTGPAGTSVPAVDDQFGSSGKSWLAGDPHTRPAEFTDLNYTWTAIPATSPEAVALRFNPNDKYAIGTTDGPDGSTTNAVYARTDNGWDAIEPIDGLEVELVGDTVYVAEQTEDGLEALLTTSLRAFDIPTRTWSEVAAPPEASPSGAEGLLGRSSVSISSTKESLVAQFTSEYQLDPQAFGLDENTSISTQAQSDGSMKLVVLDFTCFDEAVATINEADANGAPEPEVDSSECERIADPSEFGLNAADMELLSSSLTTLWTLKDGTWQQVQLPEGLSASLMDGGLLEVYTPSDDMSTQIWAVSDDASVRPLFDGKSFNQIKSVSLSVGRPYTGRALLISGTYLLSQDLSGDDWSAIDLNKLGDGPGWGTYETSPDLVVETADGGLIATGSVAAQLPTEVTELTSGDYTIRFDPNPEGETVVINNATGEEIVNLTLSTESGQIDVSEFDAEGNDTYLATFDADWTDVPALNTESKQAVYASPDGVRFGAVDSDTLMELVNDRPTDDLQLNGIRDNAGKIIARGLFVNSAGDQEGEEYLFVGTPN